MKILSTYEADKGGIHSLMGFTFQIKVFLYYMLNLKKGMQIEFEKIEDVSVKTKLIHLESDTEKFVSKFTTTESNKVIQVKRTKIDKKSATQMLLNWLILECSDYEIDEYVLFTHEEYKNKNIIFEEPSKNLYDKIKLTDSKSKSTMAKVNNLFSSYKEFSAKYSSIQKKFSFEVTTNIEHEIDTGCEIYFRKTVDEIIYYRRIKELLNCITVEIIEAINNKNSYSLNYEKLMDMIEHITLNISKEKFSPDYANFKKLHVIDLKDQNMTSKREYKQLLACNLPPKIIIQNLLYNAYYQDLRFGFLSRRMLDPINNIEERTYENFEEIQYELERSGNDEPYKRLIETKKADNSYAESEEIKYGAAIYLTGDSIEERKISWEDESNGTIEI